MRISFTALIYALLLCAPVAAHAVAISAVASNSAIIQPGGPLGGTNGESSLDVEGNSFGSSASFGVIDFDFPAHVAGGRVTAINSAMLTLTEDDSVTTAASDIDFYMALNNSGSIDPGTSSFRYQTGSNGLAAVDPALDCFNALGVGIFNSNGATNNGRADAYHIQFSGTQLTDLISALNNGGVVRVTIDDEQANGAATFAGISNSSFAAPVIQFDAQVVVPEPTTLCLLGIGCGFAIIFRRRLNLGIHR